MRRYDYNSVEKRLCVLERPEGDFEGEWTDVRVDRMSVPEGKFLYECADDGDGNVCRISEGIIVNFFGSMITDEELSFVTGKDNIENGVIYVTDEDDFFWTD